MLGLFCSLFRKKDAPEEGGAMAGGNQRHNPFVILVGPDDDPDLQLLASPRAKYPKKRGKAVEEFQTELAAYHERLRAKGAASFCWAQKRAVSVGSKKYIWRTAKDEAVCLVCQGREGKQFSWDKAPKNGHAGMADCCPGGFCRCWPEPIINL